MDRLSLVEVRRNVAFQRPHLVVLGAGASLQAFPTGDMHGKLLPAMSNFVQTLALENLLKQSPIPYKERNFEDVYSELIQRDDCGPLVAELEAAVFEYFASLELPAEPTLCDHLLLSLRPKDGVITFNWDPFLFDAASRLATFARMPHIVFLHGNVAIGYCAKDRQKGRPGTCCSRCYTPFVPSRLLFPINKKDSQSDVSVRREWREARNGFRSAFVVTIFGYGAPRTDAEAIRLLSRAWGRAATRNLEEMEFIDTAPEDVLRDRWSQFIHTHHYRVYTDFYNSLLGRHPRRSCEAVWWQTQEMQAFEPDPMDRSARFDELLMLARSASLNLRHYRRSI
jgi:hypothetical protein